MQSHSLFTLQDLHISLQESTMMVHEAIDYHIHILYHAFIWCQSNLKEYHHYQKHGDNVILWCKCYVSFIL